MALLQALTQGDCSHSEMKQSFGTERRVVTFPHPSVLREHVGLRLPSPVGVFYSGSSTDDTSCVVRRWRLLIVCLIAGCNWSVVLWVQEYTSCLESHRHFMWTGLSFPFRFPLIFHSLSQFPTWLRIISCIPILLSSTSYVLPRSYCTPSAAAGCSTVMNIFHNWQKVDHVVSSVSRECHRNKLQETIPKHHLEIKFEMLFHLFVYPPLALKLVPGQSGFHLWSYHAAIWNGKKK